jgi:hypothetical protein
MRQTEQAVMTQRSVTHATFAIERTYDAAPARVFAAWATSEAKTALVLNGAGSKVPTNGRSLSQPRDLAQQYFL